MRSINFVIGILLKPTYHTPDYVIEQLYREQYFPFFNILNQNPHVKVVCYLNGRLLEWAEKFHKEFIDLLKELVIKGQIEFLSGGYFDPILPIIPAADRRGQIKLLNEKIKKIFRLTPHGVWLTAQSFSPAIIADLNSLGIEYVALGDFHLNETALENQQQFSPLLVNHFNQKIKALVSSEPLERLVAHVSPDKILLYLKKIASFDPQKITAVFCEPIFTEEYLSNWFEFIKANLTWLKITRGCDYFEQTLAFAKVYLKEKAAPAVEKQAGGLLQNNFTKHPELNHLYKRMLNVSLKIEALKKGGALGRVKAREEKIKAALLELYQAQCQDAYLPSETGGAYLSTIRRNAYAHLIAAEEILSNLTHGTQNFCDLSISDFDGDTYDEIEVSTKTFSAQLAPDYGGALLELDFKPKKLNLIDTFSNQATSGRKVSFLDHALTLETTLDEFRQGKAKTFAAFAGQPYSVLPKRGKGNVTVTFKREEPVLDGRLTLTKTITFFAGQSQILAEYTLKNNSKKTLAFRFGTEFCLSNLSDKKMKEAYDIEGINRVRLFDEKDKFSVLLTLDTVAHIWRYPIVNNLKLNGKLVKLNQGMVIFPNWKLSLDPGKMHSFSLKLLIEQ